jgi:lysozyme
VKASNIDLIKRFEGCRLEAYLCPASIWTIGWGHATGVLSGMKITQEQAEAYLKSDIEPIERLLNELDIPFTQNQFDALTSFIYNVGAGAFKASTLLKKLRAGEYAGDEFLRWTKAGGKELPGLVERRKAEKSLFDLI